MSAGGREAAREVLAAAVAAALRQQARQSAHPADQADLRGAAARIAGALLADFVVVYRHSPGAGLTDRKQLNDHLHE